MGKKNLEGAPGDLRQREQGTSTTDARVRPTATHLRRRGTAPADALRLRVSTIALTLHGTETTPLRSRGQSAMPRFLWTDRHRMTRLAALYRVAGNDETQRA